jgi:hypothetical protein
MMLVVVCIVSKPSLVTFPGFVPSGYEWEGFSAIDNVSELLAQPMLAEKIPSAKRTIANLKIICLYRDECALLKLKLTIG